MNETILKALLRLFAIMANVNKDGVSTTAKGIVKSYLEEHLNLKQVLEYQEIFNNFLKEHHRNHLNSSDKGKKAKSLNAVKILKYCYQINDGLQHKDKLIVLIRLLEFVNEDEIITRKELEFIETVTEVFKIEQTEYLNCKSFVLEKNIDNIDKARLLIVDGKESAQTSEVDESGIWFEQNRPESLTQSKHIYNENLRGKLYILHIESVNSFVLRYTGRDILYLNSHNILPGRAYLLNPGALIKSPKISPVYYSDISAKFIQAKSKRKIVLEARNIEFRFKNSKNGIQKFSLKEESGQLIGIMGGSGVGKSTLLNVLNGSLTLNSGEIYINGYDLHKEKNKLEGVIGFVPQDDLLIEELTVYQNLYYNAKLCFSNFTEKQIVRLIVNLMLDLDLFEIKSLKVGNPLNKFISGGQRKRLNIALELMREPSIMIIDEPTSGLSSMDSEMVMSLMKEQANKGKLVIVNIHQPSSDIFKLFDKLLVLDKGGYPVYYGDPTDSVVYFKKIINHVNAEERECVTCGNVNPEQILQIIETKELNEYGKFTRNRKISPKDWYELYKENLVDFDIEEGRLGNHPKREDLPKNSFKIPNPFEQFKIFSIRNLLSKLTNKQYLAISLLEAPLLAVILGYFTKYNHGTADDPTKYIFAENLNIPAYLFMSVIVALFLGLTISAEEIIRDRKILKRESYLHLSRVSYLHSKILYLFGLSAVQAFLFVTIGNLILGINGMEISFWFIIFTTTAFANMVGLNISAGLNSVVTIYILIPFILVPQLLLSGVIVDFNKLHKSVTTPKYTPVVGDLMVSRWSYEALTVELFKNNYFNENFYDYDQKIKNAMFKYVYLIPRLETYLDQAERNIENNQNQWQTNEDLEIIRNEIAFFPRKIDYWGQDSLTSELINHNVMESVRNYLNKVSEFYVNEQSRFSAKKDSILQVLIDSIGKDEVFALKLKHHNKRLEEFVEKKLELKKLTVEKGRIVQLNNPIYKFPEMNYGRAQFYAPVKKLFGRYYDTFWFNTLTVWLFSFIMYITLRNDSLRKIFTYFENIKLRKRFG